MDKAFKPIYASVKNDNIAAVVAQAFRFATEAQARDKLQYLERIFIKSKEQIKHPKNDVVILWIEGYEVTAAQEKKGCTGNFAAITYKKVGEKFTLYPTKMEVELKLHPQKKRVKSSHPNWGHPTLRWVKSGKVFANIEQARDLLGKLHEEYPTTSIPLLDKLNLMIYSRGEKNENPIKKYVLVIREAEGGFIIAVEEKKQKPVIAAPIVVQPEPEGKFTKMVVARRARKKRK